MLREDKFRNILKLLLPLGSILLALGLHLTLPNVYPEGYESTTYPKFLLISMGVYLGLVVMSIFSKKLRERLLYSSYLVMVAFIFIELLDIKTLKTGQLKLPFIPSPDKILESIPSNADILLESFIASMKLLFKGLIIGIVSGIASGVLIGWNRLLNYWFVPILKLVGPVPTAAWLPIVMVLFSSSKKASVFLIVLSVWFPLTLMISSAIKDTDIKYVETARMLGASDTYIMFHVAIPNSMPAMFTGLFMGLSNSFGALIVAEMLGVESGLGWYIKWAESWAEYGKVFSTVGIFIIIFFILTDLLFKLRKRIMTWQKGSVRW